MARDYKKSRASRARKDHESASPWRFLIGGFSMGVIAAAVVYYMMSPSTPRRPDEPVPESRRLPASADDEAPEEGPTAVDDDFEPPPQPVEAASTEEKFKFWKMLKEYEVILPEEDEQLQKVAPQTPISTPGKYLMQIGAFRRYADADRLKAKLALQGIECYIERIMIDEDAYHRVRIGPETELAQVNALRERLNQQDINVLVIRIPAQ